MDENLVTTTTENVVSYVFYQSINKNIPSPFPFFFSFFIIITSFLVLSVSVYLSTLKPFIEAEILF